MLDFIKLLGRRFHFHFQFFSSLSISPDSASVFKRDGHSVDISRAYTLKLMPEWKFILRFRFAPMFFFLIFQKHIKTELFQRGFPCFDLRLSFFKKIFVFLSIIFLFWCGICFILHFTIWATYSCFDCGIIEICLINEYINHFLTGRKAAVLQMQGLPLAMVSNKMEHFSKNICWRSDCPTL